MTGIEIQDMSSEPNNWTGVVETQYTCQSRIYCIILCE